MKLDDIIALAKQGYKPGDVKELIELSEGEPEDEPEDEQEDELEDEKQKEIDELKEQIKKLQEENARRDNSDNEDLKSDDEKLVDLFRDFID